MSERLGRIELPPIEVEAYNVERDCMAEQIDDGYLIVRFLKCEPMPKSLPSLTLRDGSVLMAVPTAHVVEKAK